LQDAVGARAEADVVLDAHGRDDHARLHGEAPAELRDVVEDPRAVLALHERDQAVADLERDAVDGEERADLAALLVGRVLARLGRRRAARGPRGLGGGFLPRALGGARPAPGDEQHRRQHQERKARHPGQDADHEQHPRRDQRRARPAADLAEQARPERLLGRVARDEHGGRGRHEQGRDLAHQAVADRQLRVALAGLGQRQAAGDAERDAADQVEQRDDQAGDRVAAHELRGAVHRPVELGLGGDARAALARVVGVDQAAVQVGVDRHLLAGHGVEHEARGDLADAPRALGDHHELDDDQDQEHDQADGQVVAADVLAEGVDDASRLAVGQDQARARHVETEPVQRREQQYRREGRDVGRLVRVHRHEQQQERDRDVEREQHVQHERRDRRDQRDDQAEHADAQEPVGVAPQEPSCAGDARVRDLRHRSAFRAAHAALPVSRAFGPASRTRYT
jgi:hypothetical protein